MMDKLNKCMCLDKYASYAPTILRVWLGVIFLMHGWQKITVLGIQGVTGFLGSLHIPAPEVMAYILSYGELLAGILLIIGLCVHWASKFVVIVGIVAFVTVHMASGFYISGATYGYEYNILWALVGLSLIMTGGGELSLDKKMKKGGMM